MPKPPELSIVIPAYREAAKIAADVRAAAAFLAEGPSGEILVVDDGSDDGTAARAEATGEPGLRVLRSATNRGKGHALRLGIAASRGRAVLFADAGSCVAFAQARRGLALLAAGADVAVGSRRHPDARVAQRNRFYRRLGSRAFATLARTALGLPPGIRDSQCGFKLYRGEVGRALFAACRTDGFMIDVELLRLARARGLVVREFPVTWRADPDSRFAPLRGSWRNLTELARMRRGTGQTG